MDIYESLVNGDKYNTIVMALGNFDGVHLGHRELIRRAIEIAGRENGTPAVFTFDPHPLKVLHPEKRLSMLLSKEDKIRLLSELGVQLLIIAPFDKDMYHLTPRQFVAEVLVDKFKAHTVVVGYNYTFGHKGVGNAGELVRLGREFGLWVEVVPAVSCDGVEVSSTLIRQLLREGQVNQAARMLGYYPYIVQRVVAGDRRGREIGFPTVNMELPGDLVVPANGVYAVRIYTNGAVLNGVANIGVKPTFGCDRARNLEAHIFDFCREIYGMKIRVEFIERIRGERKFLSAGDLKAQIEKDAVTAKEILQAASQV